MQSLPIFSENFLSHHLSDFKLSSVVGIRKITLQLRILIEELESGKYETLKEEEVKSRFITTLFGDILGFDYEGSERWFLREEKKSLIDGTKPDAALGYFFKEKNADDVRVILELKDANTDLDTQQNRSNKETPVEQAFGYVAKMGGGCNWVIVSNIKEIRFYRSLDRSKYQLFLLKDLLDEKHLKEFLFLFHKDRFIRERDKSSTDKLYEIASTIPSIRDVPLHVIDQMYYSLKRFDAFGFVDPKYIASIKPFNVLEDHVWHYEQRELFTLNSDIYDLLINIEIIEGKITFTNQLKSEITDAFVLEAEEKLQWIFKFLRQCLIEKISAIKDYKQVIQRNRRTIGFSHRFPFSFINNEEGVTFNIAFESYNKCDCLICTFRSLNFSRFLSKLKVAYGDDSYNNLEYAYGNYLGATNNFKTTYSIYKTIEKDIKGKQGKGALYFITKYNLLLLYNLVSDYQYDDGKEILKDIRNIDLNNVIFNELEFEVDKELKNYLIKVKEDELIFQVQDKVEETLGEISKLKKLYDGKGGQHAGPDLPGKLLDQYLLLFLHINANFIIYDKFKRYRAIVEKVFQGLIWSYQTPQWGLRSFNSFMLTEAVLHIDSDKLRIMLKDIDQLSLETGAASEMLDKLVNFASSYYQNSLFNTPYQDTLMREYLDNFRFKETFRNIFSNIFIVLSRVELTTTQFERCKKTLINYIKIDRALYWADLREFIYFIYKQSKLFTAEDLLELLTIAIHGDRYGQNKYKELIIRIPLALIKEYHNYRIGNSKLIKTALNNSTSDDGSREDYKHLINLLNICNDECFKVLEEAFENYLDKKFNGDFYEELLRETQYKYNRKDYFLKYVKYINENKGGRTIMFGGQQLTDLVFFNFILLVYCLEIDFEVAELKEITNVNDFEQWLLNPLKYDYTKFNPKWLIDINGFPFFERLRGNLQISRAIESELQREFHPILAELKYKYF